VVAKVIARLVVGGRGEKSVIGARKWLAARYNIAAVATVAALLEKENVNHWSLYVWEQLKYLLVQDLNRSHC
jgi:hypothetical protein